MSLSVVAKAGKLTGPGGLQLKIVAEDKVIDSRVGEFIADWEANK